MTLTQTVQSAEVTEYDLDGLVEWLSPGSVTRPNPVEDIEKYDDLVTDMAARGWVGAPMVYEPALRMAFTGSHRITAARTVGIDVAGVDVETLLDSYGDCSWEALLEECGDDPAEAARFIDGHLPRGLAGYLGLDWH